MIVLFLLAHLEFIQFNEDNIFEIHINARRFDTKYHIGCSYNDIKS